MTTGNRSYSSITRRGLLAGVFGSALLVACGDSDEDAPSTPSASPTAQASAAPIRLIPGTPVELGAPVVPAAAKSTAAVPVTAASLSDPYKNFGTTAAPGVFPRTIKHATGEVVLNTAPTRIVTMDTAELDAMAALGIKPVGATDYGAGGMPAYLTGALDGTKNLGASTTPELESIAALRPELILSSKFRHEKLYSTIAAIAPTLFIERPGYGFKQAFALYAQATGKEKEASAVVAQYEARAKQLNAKLPTPRPTVSIIRVLSTNNLRYYLRTNFIDTILTDLGLPRPAAQNVDDFSFDAGLESLGQYANADLIALSVFSNSKTEYSENLVKSPLWLGLEAVKNGKVLEVDDKAWIAGIGYRAAFSIFDDLAKYFKIA